MNQLIINATIQHGRTRDTGLIKEAHVNVLPGTVIANQFICKLLQRKSVNIKLRMRVLEASIRLEDLFSEVLSQMFKIKKDDSLTLGMKSSSLTFKSKVDLLTDLNRISPEEKKQFIFFMEIRNKLAHSLQIDTLEKALMSLGNNKIKALLANETSLNRYYQLAETVNEKEELLALAFDKLYIKLTKIVLSIMKELIDEQKSEDELRNAKMYGELAKSVIKAIDSAINEYSGITDKVFFPDESEFHGIAKKSIKVLFKKHFKELRPDITAEIII